jgi:hypothetical protein
MRITIQKNIIKLLNIKNNETTYIIKKYLDDQNPTKLTLTRNNIENQQITHITQIKETEVFPRKKIFGIKIEKPIGYSYHTITIPKHIVKNKIPIIYKKNEGELILYVE